MTPDRFKHLISKLSLEETTRLLGQGEPAEKAEIYGHDWPRAAKLAAAVAIVALLLNFRVVVISLLEGRFWIAAATLPLTVGVLFVNRWTLSALWNRLKTYRYVSLRGKIRTGSPGFGSIADWFPYYVFSAAPKRGSLWSRLMGDLRGAKRCNRMNAIIERKIRRMHPGIRHAEVSRYSADGRRFRVWFKKPSDAVAFKLRYSDEIDILSMDD
jgi:hypothetical protein